MSRLPGVILAVTMLGVSYLCGHFAAWRSDQWPTNIIASRYPAIPIRIVESFDFLRLAKSVELRESGGNPYCPDGAAGERGCMQIMKGTWEDRTAGKGKSWSWDQARNPVNSRAVGLAQLYWVKKYIEDRHGPATVQQIAAGYNGGVGLLRRSGWSIDRLPASVQDYARSVSGHYRRQDA